MKRTLIFLILSLSLISASITYADEIDNLIKILKTGTVKQQTSAIYTLAKMKDPRAVEPLIQILRQDKGLLRGTAAYALGRIGDKRAVEPLLKVLREVLESDSSGGNSEPIIGALGTIGDKRAVEPLIKILRNDKENMFIRTRTVWALMNIGGQKAEEALRDIRAKDKAPAIQETTKHALAKLDREKIQALQKVVEPKIDNIIKSLETGTPEQKIKALRKLKYVEDHPLKSKAVKSVIKLLNHSDIQVRQDATQSLNAFMESKYGKVRRHAARAIVGNLGGDPRAIEPLIKLLDDPDRNVKKTVLFALENTAQKEKDKRIMYAFLKALDTDSWDVARAASGGLEVFGTTAKEPMLQMLKTNPPPMVRRFLLLNLGRVSGDEILPLLKKYTEDSDRWVREYAVRGIGTKSSERIELLESLMKSKYTYVRREVLDVAAEDREHSHLSIFVRGLQDKDIEVRTAAAKGLAKKIDDEEASGFFINYLLKPDADKDVKRLLITWLKNDVLSKTERVTELRENKRLVETLEKVLVTDSDKEIRTHAATLLGKIGDKDSVPVLIKALEDNETSVRRTAAYALKWNKDKKVIISLIDTLKKELNKYKLGPSRDRAHTISTIIGVLGEADDDRATDTLIQTLEYDKFKTSAIRALDKLEDPKSAKALIPLLKKDIDPRVRIDSMRALRKIEGEKATPYILDVFEKDTNPKVRKVAAGILESIGDEKAIGPLEAALKDPNKEVAKAAKRALFRITGKDYSWKVVSPEQYEKNTQKIIELTEKIKSDKISERQDAMFALKKLKDERVIEPLLLALKDENYAMRGNTASALSNIVKKLDNPEVTRRVIPEVKKLLNDEKAYVRKRAFHTLCTIDSEEMLPLVLEKINSKGEKVQYEGVDALSRMKSEIALPKLVEILQDKKRSNNVIDSTVSGIYQVISRETRGRIKKPLLNIATQPLLEIIQDKSKEERTRREAARIIRLMKDRNAVEPLIGLLTVEENISIKSELIGILGGLKDRRALPILEELTKDESAHIRSRVDIAIKSILPRREYEARVKEAEEAKKKVKQLMREGKKVYAQKNVPEAVKNFEEAVSTLERIREERPEKFSPSELYRPLTYLAFIHYLDLKEPEKAISYLKKLLTYYEKKKVASMQDFIIMYSNFWIAKIYETELQDYSKALPHYEKCTNYALQMMKEEEESEEARYFFLLPVALPQYYYDNIKANILKERRYKIRPLKVDYLSFRALQFGSPTLFDYLLLGEPFIELLMTSKDLSIYEEKGREGTVKLYRELGEKYSGTYTGALLKFYALRYSYIYLPSFLKYAEDYGYGEEDLSQKELVEEEKRLFEPFALDFIKKYPDDLLTLYVRLNLKDFYQESGERVKEKKMVQTINEFTSQKNIQVRLEPDKRYATPEKTWEAFRKALMEGNIEAALDCISTGSKKRYRKVFEQLGKAGLKKIAKDMEPIHKISENEEVAEYIILRIEKGKEFAYNIYFTNEFEEWKIDVF